MIRRPPAFFPPPLLAAALAALLAAACRPAPEPAVLEPVPRPALERFEPVIREQLEAARRELDGLLAQHPTGGRSSSEALARVYGRLGRLYLAYQLRSAAAASLGNAAVLAPAEHRWAYYRAVACRGEGRLDEASVAFEKALELRPDDPPTLLHLADLELDRRRLERSRKLYRRVLEEVPRSAAALYGLGRIEALEGRPVVAVERFREALALQPQASAVRHALGLAYRETGDLAAAERELAAGGPRRPTFPDPLVEDVAARVRGARAQLSRGAEARRQGELEAAAEHFRRAVEQAPADAVALYNLGSVLGELGRHEEAGAALAEAVARDPRLADGWLNLGVAQARLGRLEEAADSFGRLLELDPGDPEALLRRAQVRRRLGRPAEALEDLNRLGSAGEATAEVLLERASLELQLDRPGAAAASAGRAVDLTREEALRGRAELLRIQARLLAGDCRAARQRLEALAAGGSQAPVFTHLLARLLATCPQQAERDGERALTLARRLFGEQRSVEHGRTVAMALAETGRIEEARRWQAELLEEARRAGAGEAVLARLWRELASYSAGRPVREPWRETGESEDGGGGG